MGSLLVNNEATKTSLILYLMCYLQQISLIGDTCNISNITRIYEEVKHPILIFSLLRRFNTRNRNRFPRVNLLSTKPSYSIQKRHDGSNFCFN